MKNNLLGKKILSCSFYLYRFRKYVSYGFRIIIFCNPGVYYETPCILPSETMEMTHCYGIGARYFFLKETLTRKGLKLSRA